MVPNLPLMHRCVNVRVTRDYNVPLDSSQSLQEQIDFHEANMTLDKTKHLVISSKCFQEDEPEWSNLCLFFHHILLKAHKKITASSQPRHLH